MGISALITLHERQAATRFFGSNRSRSLSRCRVNDRPRSAGSVATPRYTFLDRRPTRCDDSTGTGTLPRQAGTLVENVPEASKGSARIGECCGRGDTTAPPGHRTMDEPSGVGLPGEPEPLASEFAAAPPHVRTSTQPSPYRHASRSLAMSALGETSCTGRVPRSSWMPALPSVDRERQWALAGSA